MSVGSSNGTRRLGDGLGWFNLDLGSAQLVEPGVMNRLVGADDDAVSRAVQRWLGGLGRSRWGWGLSCGVGRWSGCGLGAPEYDNFVAGANALSVQPGRSPVFHEVGRWGPSPPRGRGEPLLTASFLPLTAGRAARTG
jgi:hypothetical protein